MSTTIRQFDEQSFREAVSGEKPVLVDFYADWCPPCKVIAPSIEEVAAEYGGKAIVGKIDVDSEQGLASEFGVLNIPTVLVLVNGEVAERFVGIRSKEDYAKAIDAASAV